MHESSPGVTLNHKSQASAAAKEFKFSAWKVVVMLVLHFTCNL